LGKWSLHKSLDRPEFKRDDGSVFKQDINIDKLDKELLSPFERYDDLRLKPGSIKQLKKGY